MALRGSVQLKVFKDLRVLLDQLDQQDHQVGQLDLLVLKDQLDHQVDQLDLLEQKDQQGQQDQLVQ
jgi:hypothetical protein